MIRIFSSLGRDLGIDIGTVNTHIHVQGRGVVLSEPSLVATDTKQEGIVAVGADAERLLLRTPDMLDEMRPLRDGFIVDYRVMLTMLRHFMNKASRTVGRTRVIMAVPCGITDVEKRAMTDAIIQAGAREAYLLEAPVAAALGCHLPVFEACGSMAVDIGGGTTDIGVMALGGKVIAHSARIGGHDFNESILQYIKNTFSVMVAVETVEEIKLELGTALPPQEEAELSFLGRDIANGLMKRIIIRKSEVYQVMQETLQRIVDEIKSVVEQTPPELAADIMERGMILTGATALMEGLGQRLSEELGIPVQVPAEPGFAVAVGLGEASKEFARMERFIIASKNRKGRA
ncbi:rod shape-determining protein [Veillonella intestinalis]|uniref:rod shape-determining protein n=1 Tax=Veillonella intestinalis TaxID=2941341 RepID=UPI00203FC6D2|nr:rod shape-determining protein [Veillonella intestinalis]